MKPKQLVILAVVLVAVLVAALLASKSRHSAGVGTAAKLGQSVFPGLEVNEVAKIMVVGPEDSVTLSQRGSDGAWGVDDRGGFTADVAKVRTFVIDLSNLKVAQTTTVGASQYGRLGLLPPESAEGGQDEKGTVVTLQSSDGSDLVKATIGKGYKTGTSADGGSASGRYLHVEGQPEVYVISDQLYSLQTQPSNWLKKESFRVEKPKSVTISSPEGEGGFTLSKETEDGKFALADVSENETLDETKVGGFGNIFSSGSFADVLVGDAAADEKTGLDMPTTVSIETFDGFKYDIGIGEKIEEGGDESEDEDEMGAAPKTTRYPVRYTVSAEIPTERKVEDEETEDVKKTKDSEFELKQKTMKEKLENEKAMEGTVFLLDNWVIDQVLKKRSDLIKAPEAEGDESEGAANATTPPGISVTTPPVVVPPVNGDLPKKPITATTPPVSLEDAIKTNAEEQAQEGDSVDPSETTEEMKPEATETTKDEDAAEEEGASEPPAEATPEVEATPEGDEAPAEAAAEDANPQAPPEDAAPTETEKAAGEE